MEESSASPAEEAPPTNRPGCAKRLCYGLILFSFSSLICLVVLELVCRIVAPASPFSPYLPLRPTQNMELHVDLPGCSPIAHFTTNRWGLRGDEPPEPFDEAFTIVTIGGSTTQCFYLDDAKTWPHLLQERLRTQRPDVWVGNGGLDGHTSRGHIVFMEEAISRIRPDMVIVLAGVNDLALSLVRESPHIGPARERTSLKEKLYGASRLAQILWSWKLILANQAVHVRRSTHHAWQDHPLEEDESWLPGDLRTLLPQLDEFRANVRRIIQLGREMNVEVVFLTQPLEFDDTPHYRSVQALMYWAMDTKHTISCATYWRMMEIYNQALQEVCQEEGARCFDLAGVMPHDPACFYDAFHYTEQGADFIASSLADFLIRENALAPPARTE